MPTQTRAQLVTTLQALADLFEETRKYGEENAANLIGKIEAVEESVRGDRNDLITRAMRSTRNGYANVLSAIGPALEANIRDWGRFIGSDHAEGNFSLLFADWYQWFVDNGETVLTRGISYASMAAAAGNVGDGDVVRLTEDENGFPIENVTIEGKTVECIADHNSGAEKGRERFRIFGDPSGRDNVETRGSGSQSAVEATAAHPALGLLLNPSFDQVDNDETTPASVPNWDVSPAVVGDGSDVELDPADTYLPPPNDNITTRSLVLKVSKTLTQKLINIRKPLDRFRPFFIQLAYKPDGATGTIELRFGAQTTGAIALAGSAWLTLRLAVDQNLWFKNLNEDSLDVQIIYTKSGGTNLKIDDTITTRFTPHDGLHYVVVPGRTPYLVGDKFSGTDSGPDSKIQRMLNFYFRRFVPAAASATITDP